MVLGVVSDELARRREQPRAILLVTALEQCHAGEQVDRIVGSNAAEPRPHALRRRAVEGRDLLRQDDDLRSVLGQAWHGRGIRRPHGIVGTHGIRRGRGVAIDGDESDGSRGRRRGMCEPHEPVSDGDDDEHAR